MKTNIRKLDSVTHNDTAATKLINDNFEALQQGIEDALSRSGKTPNFMDAALDMNMNRIINIADPVDDYDLANKHYVDTKVAGLQEQIDDEVERATAAEAALDGKIDAEELRAKAAEDELDGKITAEKLAREAADLVLDGKITAEANRAKGVEGTLSNLTTTDKTSLVDAINEVDGDVASIEETIESYGDIVTHDTDEFASAVSMSLNSSTYVLTIQLKDKDGNNVGTAQTVDLPLESIIVSGYYDSVTKSIILTLDNGNTITIPVGDLVSGLQEEITSSNKLDADLVDDSTSTNKFVTAADKTAWDGKQNTLTFDSTPTPNSTNPVTSGGVYADLVGKQLISNLVTSVSGSSTDSQYPSAKLFYDTCGDIETLINAL